MAELETLTRIAEELDIELGPRPISLMSKLRDMLLEYNQHTNLTAVRDPLDVEITLLADSLLLLPLIEAERLREGREALRLIDIGTGAGFPGLPIAIADPAIEVTLVDATKKKVRFIEQASEALGLNNAIPVHARSEELAHDPGYRERFDVVTARAVASLPALIELCLPFLRVGGLALLTKGREIQEEIDAAAGALDTLGGDLYDVYRPELPEIENTSVVHVRKYKPTPKRYPRSPGTPVRSPL